MKNFKKIGLGLIAAFGVMNSQAMADSSIDQKEMQWQQASTQVNGWIEEGKVDPEMKNLVIALNLIGISVAEARYGSYIKEKQVEDVPFVELSLTYPDIEALVLKLVALEKEADLHQEILKEFDLWDLPEAYASIKKDIDNLQIQGEHIYRELFRLANRYLYCLHQLLEAFYQEHTFDYDRGLVLDDLILRNHGGQFQIIRSPEEQIERQSAYRQEMEAFAYFIMSHLDNLQN